MTPSNYLLKPLGVSGHLEPIGLKEGALSLGRSEGNDVVFSVEIFPSVSGHHTQIRTIDGEVWLEDLDSKNGTYLNGELCERSPLKVGDMIQLGSIGPRFIVISSDPLSETMFVAPKQTVSSEPEVSEEQVEQIVEARARGTFWRVAFLGVLAAAALAWAASEWMQRDRDELRGQFDEKLEAQDQRRSEEMAQANELLDQLRNRDAEQEENLRQIAQEREEHAEQLRKQVEVRQGESEQLAKRLATLEGDESSAAEISRLEEMIASTNSELESARKQLANFDPVNLEISRLSGVSRVREAVALIEVSISLVDTDTGSTLHMTSIGEPNFEDDGQPWSMDSTGSGFCVHPDGWLFTNAHVIRPPDADDIMFAADELPIEPQTLVSVVFSGTDVRHPATIERIAENGIDLALIKIEPFETMPFIPSFNPDQRTPPPGSDIFTFGFPLGKFALQEGRKVIASTFRGILSRVVDGNLQVDAAVIPGNSGGPITDPQGRVVGVVYSVQATPEQTAVYNIGYGIPIKEAMGMWPPDPSDTDPGTDSDSE